MSANASTRLFPRSHKRDPAFAHKHPGGSLIGSLRPSDLGRAGRYPTSRQRVKRTSQSVLPCRMFGGQQPPNIKTSHSNVRGASPQVQASLSNASEKGHKPKTLLFARDWVILQHRRAHLSDRAAQINLMRSSTTNRVLIRSRPASGMCSWVRRSKLAP
jgi:hypothetical protein